MCFLVLPEHFSVDKTVANTQHHTVSLLGKSNFKNSVAVITEIDVINHEEILTYLFIIKISALAGVAQWIECWPTNQRVTGLIPSQSTYLCYKPGPQKGAHERQPHIDVSLSFSFPSSR